MSPANAEAALETEPLQTTKRGINIDWLNSQASPRAEDLFGFNWVRLIAHPRGSVHPDSSRAGETLSDYLEQLRALGIQSILVLPLQSFGDIGAIVPRMQEYVEDLDPDVWQIGNEPDAGWHPSHTDAENSAEERHSGNPASWCMDPLDYVNLLNNCVPIIRLRRPNSRIITAGMACGFPDWMDAASWAAVLAQVDGIALHPYLKKPESGWPDDGVVEGDQRPFVGDLLDQYGSAVGDATAIWVTEFGTTDQLLHTEYYARMYCTLEARTEVQAACAFCYSDAMDNRGYALLNTDAWTPLLSSPPLSFD